MPKVIDLPTATTLDSGDYLIMEKSSGGTKKITKSNALSNIGTTPSSVAASTSTLVSGAWTSIGTMSLDAGVWVVSAQINFTSISGTFRIGMNISVDGTLDNKYGCIVIPFSGSSSQAVVLNATRIVNFANGGTIYLLGYQTSGSSVPIGTSASRITAVRII